MLTTVQRRETIPISKSSDTLRRFQDLSKRNKENTVKPVDKFKKLLKANDDPVNKFRELLKTKVDEPVNTSKQLPKTEPAIRKFTNLLQKEDPIRKFKDLLKVKNEEPIRKFKDLLQKEDPIRKFKDLLQKEETVSRPKTIETLNEVTELLMDADVESNQAKLVELFSSMGGWLWQNKSYILKSVLYATLISLILSFSYAFYMGGFSVYNALQLLSYISGSSLPGYYLGQFLESGEKYGKNLLISKLAGFTTGQILALTKNSETIKLWLEQKRVPNERLAAMLLKVNIDVRNKTYEEMSIATSQFIATKVAAGFNPSDLLISLAQDIGQAAFSKTTDLTKDLIKAGYNKTKGAANMTLEATKNIMKARASRGEVTLDANQFFEEHLHPSAPSNISYEGELGDMVDAVNQVRELTTEALIGDDNLSIEDITQSIDESSPVMIDPITTPQVESNTKELIAKFALGVGAIALTGLALSQDPKELFEILKGLMPEINTQDISELVTPTLLKGAEIVKEYALARTMVSMTILKGISFNNLMDSLANKLTPEQEHKARNLAEMLRREKDASKVSKYTKKFMSILSGKKYYSLEELNKLSLTKLNEIAKTKGYTGKYIKNIKHAKEWIYNAQSQRINEINNAYNAALKGITTTFVITLTNDIVNNVSTQFTDMSKIEDLEARQKIIDDKFAEAQARMGEIDAAQLKAKLDLARKNAVDDLTNKFKEAQALKEAQMKWRLENEVDIKGPEPMPDDYVMPPDVLDKIGKYDEYTPLAWRVAEAAIPRFIDTVPLLNTINKGIDVYNVVNEAAAIGSQLTGALKVIGALREAIELQSQDMTPAFTTEDIDTGVNFLWAGSKIRAYGDIPSLGKLATNMFTNLAEIDKTDSLKSLVFNVSKGAILNGWDYQRIAMELSKGLVFGSDKVGTEFKDINFTTEGGMRDIMNRITKNLLETLQDSKRT